MRKTVTDLRGTKNYDEELYKMSELVKLFPERKKYTWKRAFYSTK